MKKGTEAKLSKTGRVLADLCAHTAVVASESAAQSIKGGDEVVGVLEQRWKGAKA